MECPTCRAETKCDLEEIPTNFLVMEMIRQFGLLDPTEMNLAKEPRKARPAEKEPTIDEMIDEQYRQLIADVKGELMSKFDELREDLRKSTMEMAQSELEELSYSVLDAVRDAYDGISEDSDDNDNEDAEDDDGDDEGGDDDDDEKEGEGVKDFADVSSSSFSLSSWDSEDEKSADSDVVEMPIAAPTARRRTITVSSDDSSVIIMERGPAEPEEPEQVRTSRGLLRALRVIQRVFRRYPARPTSPVVVSPAPSVISIRNPMRSSNENLTEDSDDDDDEEDDVEDDVDSSSEDSSDNDVIMDSDSSQ